MRRRLLAFGTLLILIGVTVGMAIPAEATGNHQPKPLQHHYCQTWEKECSTTTTTEPTTLPSVTSTTILVTTSTVPMESSTKPSSSPLSVQIDCKYITVSGGEWTFQVNGAAVPIEPDPPFAPGTYLHNSAPGHGWGVYDVNGQIADFGTIPTCDPELAVLPFTGEDESRRANIFLFGGYGLLIMGIGAIILMFAWAVGESPDGQD